MCTYMQLATEHTGIDHVSITMATLLVVEFLHALDSISLRLSLAFALLKPAPGLLALCLGGCLAFLEAPQHTIESFFVIGHDVLFLCERPGYHNVGDRGKAPPGVGVSKISAWETGGRPFDFRAHPPRPIGNRLPN